MQEGVVGLYYTRLCVQFAVGIRLIGMYCLLQRSLLVVLQVQDIVGSAFEEKQVA